MKKIILSIVLIVAIALGWYLFSPLFIDEEVQEAIPEAFVIQEEEKAEGTLESAVSPDETSGIDSAVNSGPTVTHTNTFEKVDYDVSGSYQIIENDGNAILRIEDLDITNGPDLHFVLSNTNQAWGNSDYVNIAPLPGNKGSYNVPLPEGVDPSAYEYLLIHCVQFAHTFASANL